MQKRLVKIQRAQVVSFKRAPTHDLHLMLSHLFLWQIILLALRCEISHRGIHFRHVTPHPTEGRMGKSVTSQQGP